MRRLFLGAVLSCMMLLNVACFVPIYSGDPPRRAEQLFYTAENLRVIFDEWERIWFLDMPSHATPVRTHGGII